MKMYKIMVCINRLKLPFDILVQVKDFAFTNIKEKTKKLNESVIDSIRTLRLSRIEYSIDRKKNIRVRMLINCEFMPNKKVYVLGDLNSLEFTYKHCNTCGEYSNFSVIHNISCKCYKVPPSILEIRDLDVRYLTFDSSYNDYISVVSNDALYVSTFDGRINYSTM